MWGVAVLVATGAWFAPTPASAQLAERVAQIDDGVVRFEYETKPGVEICAQGIRIDDDQMWWRSERGERVRDCRFGPAEVEVEVRRGVVRDVEIIRDRGDRDRDALDLGPVGPGEAAGFLLSLAYRGATDDAAEDAIFPAMIADVDGVWRELLDIARDRSVHSSVRKNTLFWLGQEAADAATEGLVDVAQDDKEDQEIRNSAIFALSQRDADEAVPALMDIARTSEHAESRRTAMFWLAQSDDPRVVPFFESILLRGSM